METTFKKVPNFVLMSSETFGKIILHLQVLQLVGGIYLLPFFPGKSFDPKTWHSFPLQSSFHISKRRLLKAAAMTVTYFLRDNFLTEITLKF